jgi:hypothetical protein
VIRLERKNIVVLNACCSLANRLGGTSRRKSGILHRSKAGIAWAKRDFDFQNPKCVLSHKASSTSRCGTAADDRAMAQGYTAADGPHGLLLIMNRVIDFTELFSA